MVLGWQAITDVLRQLLGLDAAEGLRRYGVSLWVGKHYVERPQQDSIGHDHLAFEEASEKPVGDSKTVGSDSSAAESGDYLLKYSLPDGNGGVHAHNLPLATSLFRPLTDIGQA